MLSAACALLLCGGLLGAAGCASGGIHAKERSHQQACQAADRQSEEDAMEQCQRCLKLMPEDELCASLLYGARKRAFQQHYIRGVMLNDQGRVNEAQAEFDAAARLDPDAARTAPPEPGR
ncbi:MAG: hypothetical protein PHU21_09780 [Elusimicrobia bacterium]|nr:hypothetical protein [Elusimicrobiota bacterium]